jgi:signal transduction histidine kinase
LEGKIDWNQLTPSEYHQIDQLGIQEANRTGTCTPYEKEYIHKNGHRVPILMGFAALEDTPGEFICFLLDLSPIKMVQMELLEYASRLERSNRELEAFAFVASMTFKNLSGKSRYLEIGWRNLDHWTEDERNYLTRMLNATRRMRNMIDGMLSLSRVTTQGKPFQRVNMNEVFREVLSDLENLLEREHAVVKVSDLPEIEGDPVQIRQLMQNFD